ncbi:DUF488 family protein [Candidatus Saccharibacteria bacterium]|nr:DUF488 family protein [Candidatus Saccharibacteria bacterium]
MAGRAACKPLGIYTLGQSTHPIDEFVELLKKNGVMQLVDVRTAPRSRHNPEYELTARGINVKDIMSATSTTSHTLTSFAVVNGTKVTYPNDGN